MADKGGPRFDGPFYEVSGGRDTWVANVSLPFSAKVNYGFDADRHPRCLPEPGVEANYEFPWVFNATRNFKYNLRFNDGQAMMNFTMESPHSRMNLSFVGRREEPVGNVSDNYRQKSAFGSDGVYNKIKLASPEQNPMPHFTYADGGDISWKQKGDNDMWFPNRGAGANSVGATILPTGVIRVLGVTFAVAALCR